MNKFINTIAIVAAAVLLGACADKSAAPAPAAPEKKVQRVTESEFALIGVTLNTPMTKACGSAKVEAEGGEFSVCTVDIGPLNGVQTNGMQLRGYRGHVYSAWLLFPNGGVTSSDAIQLIDGYTRVHGKAGYEVSTLYPAETRVAAWEKDRARLTVQYREGGESHVQLLDTGIERR